MKSSVVPLESVIRRNLRQGSDHHHHHHHRPPSSPVSFDIQTLPETVDWRSRGDVVTTPIKNQGGCGSCWAFASVGALESHIAINTGKLLEMSVQELVSCTPNPQSCGGSGGCTGSTAEIAYAWVAQHGMLEEWRFGYQSFHGEKVNCTILNNQDKSGVIDGAIASIAGFANLPMNSYNAMMYAVATMGPVVVNVAATGWGLYKGGIFDDDDLDQRDINHAVVLEGYGKDEETGQLFWLIRNSWSSLWGEDGRIRLKRVDPSSLDDPSSDCKIDVSPADGIACTKDKSGKPVAPANVTVCGTSGVLFDGVIPIGGHLL